MKNIGLGVLLIMILSCHGRRTKVISGLEGKPLPSFRMLLMDSVNYLNSANIPVGQPVVLFYFSPFCPYCRAQTQEIKNEINAVKDIRFYFMAPFPLKDIKQFEHHYSLSNCTNITLAQINDSAFSNYYKINAVPYTAIYNKQKQLKEVLLGKCDVDLIKKVAFEK
jgi:thiol-disulfide isomerase/thioredoxin